LDGEALPVSPAGRPERFVLALGEGVVEEIIEARGKHRSARNGIAGRRRLPLDPSHPLGATSVGRIGLCAALFGDPLVPLCRMSLRRPRPPAAQHRERRGERAEDHARAETRSRVGGRRNGQ
jgi:hypothetical protein